jgi:hypothetical protein
MTIALVAGAALAVACVLVVALPFLREPRARDDRLARPDELEQRRLSLAEERDRALAALKELEFDHRTGKVSDDDYRDLVGPLRRRAASALRALDLRAEHAADERVTTRGELPALRRGAAVPEPLLPAMRPPLGTRPDRGARPPHRGDRTGTGQL